MFKNLKLGARIGLGFASLVLLTCFLGGSNAWQMNGAIDRVDELANQYAPEAEHAAALDVARLEAQLAARTYVFTCDEKYLTQANAALEKCKELFGQLQSLSRSYPDLAELVEALPKVDAAFTAFHGHVGATGDAVRALVQSLDEVNTAGVAWATQVDALQSSQVDALQEDIAAKAGAERLGARVEQIKLARQLGDLGAQIRLAVWQARSERSTAAIQGIVGKFDEASKVIEQLGTLAQGAAQGEELSRCATATTQYKSVVGDAVEKFAKLDEINVKRIESGNAIGETVAALSASAIHQSTIHATASRDALTAALFVLYTGLGAAIVVGILLGWFITRGITKPVNRIIQSLTDGANQVNDAARQVSSASQQLAAGAGEQASSLEETSSALEQMAAMTRTNAANSEKANGLASQARQNATTGEKTMGELNNAMTAINDSAAQIGKIIKVIEEIAFQTNLLALNAAVEAARAGEHGKGFAVVAEEVRNLAQRSAQAARDTTTLIEGAVTRAKEGTTVASEAAKSLNAIVGDVANVAELLSGISRASNEQAQGVDQINSAVSQMDKVTQQNAAGAEESASAAEELSAQALTVKAVVEELTALVRGGRAACGSDGYAGEPRQPGRPKKSSKPEASPKSALKPAPKPASRFASKPDVSKAASEDEQFAALAETAQSCETKSDGSSGDLSGF
jgi:methyl-accepting chemotaxis protein